MKYFTTAASCQRLTILWNEKKTDYYGEIFAGTLLETIMIPEGVRSISDGAFRNYSNLTHFELPDSIGAICGMLSRIVLD